LQGTSTYTIQTTHKTIQGHSPNITQPTNAPIVYYIFETALRTSKDNEHTLIQTTASPHTSLHEKQRTHKYMVSILHNLILIFHILTIIVLTINFNYTNTYNTNDYLHICCHNIHNNGIFI